MTYEAFVRFNEEQGLHWFKPDTMRFFDSKIHDWDVKTGFFISSEKGPVETSKRKFTIRRANFETGSVSTFSSFQAYSTLYQAQRALEDAVAAES